MSFLGILKNVAKVGVGLLNGVLNGNSNSLSAGTFEDLAAANPDLVYTDATTKVTYRMISKYVMVHPEASKLGATLEPSVVEDGEVSIVLADGSDGKKVVHCINHSKSPYLVDFNSTDSAGTVNIRHAICYGTDSKQGNSIDITDPFVAFPTGNIVTTRVENNDNAPTPGTLMLPPLSTVLANVGIATLISTISTVLFGTRTGSLSISWRLDSANKIIGFTLTNSTGMELNVTATLNWSNPRTARTYNAAVAGNGTQDVDIELAPNPVNSASMAVYSGDSLSPSQKQSLYDEIARRASFEGVRVVNAQYAACGQGSGGSSTPSIPLTPAEEETLLRIVPSFESNDISDFSDSNLKLIAKCKGQQGAQKEYSRIVRQRAALQ
jgi:hypothetical protein